MECSIKGCKKPKHTRGYCSTHYRGLLKRGDIKAIDPEERFYCFTTRTLGCWFWEGGLDKEGYGKFYCKNKTLKAHRYSYELIVGSIPKDLVIDHLCRVRSCVNPDHMEVVTRVENIKRGKGHKSSNPS